ncbi:MAG: glycosyltransferase [Methanoregulaceae archaeon]|jgi:glycosyltransferase involved in cell wall biosynthesis
MKLAIVSPVLPPSQSGQAIVLYRLLEGTDPDRYILISPTNYNHAIYGIDDCSQKLPGRYYHIPHSHHKLVSWLLRMNYYGIGLINEIYLKTRINHLIKIFQTEKCTHVIACTADLFDPYCAYMASKKINIPFFLYAFDDYIQQWTNKYYHDFAEKTGPSIIKNAKEIIAPNNHLKSFYDTNYGVNAKTIHNPVNLSEYAGKSLPELGYSFKSEINIIFTGAIYGAQMDALNRLLDAISKINEKNIRLHLFSPNHWEPVKCDEFVIYHNPLPLSQMADVQMSAHILFLPLAFKSEYPDSLINTSSPGKMGEYLASGRPILVHAPQDSFVSWYFKKYKCGSVVDSVDVNELTKEIERLIRDVDYRQGIMKNARMRAVIDFDLTKIREQFFSIFS